MAWSPGRSFPLGQRTVTRHRLVLREALGDGLAVSLHVCNKLSHNGAIYSSGIDPTLC